VEGCPSQIRASQGTVEGERETHALEPMALMAFSGGPMKVMPLSLSSLENSAFSERNLQGWASCKYGLERVCG